VKAIYFEDVSLTKMREFRQLLLCFQNIEHTIGSFLELNRTDQLKSKRLKALLTYNDGDTPTDV
jgi:hypothetical protein